jgi:arsenate reductase-like glutaredoxin family protein
MKHNTEILQELNAISPAVADVPKVNVYSVYDNYFAEIQNDVLAAIQDNSAFEVPVGYFENLAPNILQKIRANDVAEELQNISATVANIGNANVYTAPQNYFEKLTHDVNEKQETKIIPIGNSRTKVVRLAAAAMVTGLLGFGIFTFVQKNSDSKNQTASLIKAADKILSTNSFDKDFATLSDKDLEKYLEQSGVNVEAAMVATSTEDAELPEVVDYYLDENTLNDFLNENNLKN